MKTIKYWHVKLFQRSSHTSIVSNSGAAVEKLLHEGFSKDKPRFRHDSESTIELLTQPDELESKLIRTYGIDTVICTPVYESDEEEVAAEDRDAKEPKCTGYKASSQHFSIEINIPSKDDLSTIFAGVCEDLAPISPSHSAFRVVFEEMMRRVRESINGSIAISDEALHCPYSMRGNKIQPFHKTNQ